MKLTIINGSPRGKNSNSSVITQWLLEGIGNHKDYETETAYLNRIQDHESTVGKMANSDMVIIIFPLYADCMPGLVMAFIERLQPLKGSLQGKKLGFIVHSGFPEACHSRYVERYLVWLSKELNADYMGTAITAGSEGFRVMPESMTRKKRSLYNQLGAKMMETGSFDPELSKMISGAERLPKLTLLLYRILGKTGVANFYWNGMLKRNNAYDNRSAKPYA